MKSIFNMYYNSVPKTEEKAKTLRKNETKAEKILWGKLKAKQISGYKFRRQHPLSQFIVDFYCHELKLVIEVDGEIHNKPENRLYDKGRTYELENFGIKIIRFTNYEIENKIDDVLHKNKEYVNNY